MAESRESYVAGTTETTGGTAGSSMRDMDRMLDETLGNADAEDRRSYVAAGDTSDSEDAGAAETDPDVTRSRIEQTRARMSETIDEIEGALLRKKENLQDRLNVFSPVEKNPLPSVGIALGAGLLLGYLTGGDDDEHGSHHASARRPQTADDEFWSRRASDWEGRARRLLELAQRQEVELSELRGRKESVRGFTSPAYGSASASTGDSSGDRYEVDLEESGSQEDRWERVRSPIRNVGDTVVESLTGFLTRAAREISGSHRG